MTEMTDLLDAKKLQMRQMIVTLDDTVRNPMTQVKAQTKTPMNLESVHDIVIGIEKTPKTVIGIGMTENHGNTVKDLEKNLESDLLTATEEKRTAI